MDGEFGFSPSLVRFPSIFDCTTQLTLSTACLGGMLFGWDIGAIGGIIVMPSFQKKYGLGQGFTNAQGVTDEKAKKAQIANLTSNIVSTLQAGCFLGALLAYYIADKWGRRVC